jgi:hypothetical protein
MGTMLTSPNSGIINDPFSSILQGIVHGVQLHNQIQRAQDEHAAEQRAAFEQQRNNRIQDITQKMLLQGNSREIAQDGTVTQEGAPLTDFTGESTPVSITRKAVPSRTVTYKDQDGNTIRRELLSDEEQRAKQIRERTALAHAGQVDVSGIMRQMTGGQGLDTPEGQISPLPGAAPQNQYPEGLFLNPAQVPSFMNDVSADQLVPTSPEQQALGAPKMARRRDLPSYVRSQTTRADNQTNNETKNTAKAARLTKTYTDDQNNMVGVYDDGTTKLLGPALKKPVGRTGVTPGQNAITDRKRQAQQQADQSTVEKQQQQEQALWMQKKSLEDAVATPDGGKIPNPLNPKTSITMTPGYRKTHQDNLDATVKKIAGLQQSQKRLIEKWGGGAPAPPAATATTPAAGDTVRVISPDGTPGTIPADKLDAALKRGFKRAN